MTLTGSDNRTSTLAAPAQPEGSRMTSDLAEAHRAALQNTQGIVDAITVDPLHLPAPCQDWDVEMLIHHVVYGNWWVAPLVKGETIEQVGDRFEGDILGGNFSDAHAESGA